MGEMSILKKKVASRRGASITFALLLFLVCAVVSSVVIVASTAAAGRMSRMAEMDQRYYAVTSAAELLCEDIAGKTATVVVTTTTQVAEGATPTVSVPTIPTDESSGSALADDAAVQLITLRGQTGELASTSVVKTYNLATRETDDPLKCTVKETINKDGTLVLNIKNQGAADKGIYELAVTFYAEVTASETETTTPAETEGAPDNNIKTATSVVTWKLYRVKRVNAYEAS